MVRVIILFFLVIFFLACNKTNRIKIVTEVVDGLKVEYQFDSIKNVKQGFYKSYHQNGKLASERFYVNDTLDGKEKLYYPSGKLYGEFTLSKGIYEGTFKYYFEDGKVMQDGKYISNAISGELKTYYKSGKLKEIVSMENNEEKGPFTEYFENGNIKAKGFYAAGPNSENCLLEIFDENKSGLVISKKYCQSGICCDVWSSEKGNVKPSSDLCTRVIEEMKDQCK
jgi:antitoxin component YwqK of YwqJK toxin-antitoxin module